MYEVKDTIAVQPYDGLTIQKIASRSPSQLLLITLEKDAVFPEHISPIDANLVVLEGEIIFYIQGRDYIISKHHHFQFEKEVSHWVKATKNSKFLIIR